MMTAAALAMTVVLAVCLQPTGSDLLPTLMLAFAYLRVVIAQVLWVTNRIARIRSNKTPATACGRNTPQRDRPVGPLPQAPKTPPPAPEPPSDSIEKAAIPYRSPDDVLALAFEHHMKKRAERAAARTDANRQQPIAERSRWRSLRNSTIDRTFARLTSTASRSMHANSLQLH